MRALVVFESMFGNTRDVARAVAEGLSTRMGVELVEVGSARWRADVDLLVVGGPTHAFSMSRPGTREDAARQAELAVISTGTGIREWLENLSGVRAGTSAATFDTRVARPRLPGSAARAMHKRLGHAGLDLVVGPESFWVDGTRGPLVADEVARAKDWGAELANRVARRAHVTPDAPL